MFGRRKDGDEARDASQQTPYARALTKRLLGEDVFAGFVPTGMEVDLQGWGSHQFLMKVIETLTPKTVIEVGVWKGKSAIAMAKALQEVNAPSAVVCVDTWLGSSEHFLAFQSDLLNRRHGRPQLYEQFLHNVHHSGVSDYIVPLPVSSQSAAQVLTKAEVSADLIHIDGAHGYREVLADIQAFWPLLGSDGVMICDDYAIWGGVTRAVNEFAAEQNIPVIGTHGKALLSASRKMVFRSKLADIKQKDWQPIDLP